MDNIRAIENDAVDRVYNNTYYRKIQKNLREKIDKTSFQNADQSDQQQEKPTNPVKKKPMFDIDDKVQIKKFNWDLKDDPKLEKKQHIQSKEIDIQKNQSKEQSLLLKSIGFKIDFTSKITEMKQTFMDNLIQSKTSNQFLSLYSKMKVGVMGHLLSIYGITQDELIKLQKKALKIASDENITLMAENVYNMELTTIFHGNSKKTRKARRMFSSIQQKLLTQMSMLGKADYWTKVRIVEERIKQCKRIRQELVTEKMALQYMYELKKQDQVIET